MSSPQGSIATKTIKTIKKIERMTIPEKDKTDVVCRTLKNVSKDIPNYMILRESLQNEIDSAVMRDDNKDVEICFDPFHNNDGSIMVSGEGIGFTESVVIDNFNSMFNSYKFQELELQRDFDECKGIGIKSAAYGRIDLEYKTRSCENAIQFKFTSDADGYPGLEKYTNVDDDGDEYEESIATIGDSDFSRLNADQTGTELLMTSIDGSNLSENLANCIHSIFGRAGKKLKENYGWSYARFFNMRYWSFPKNIKVKVVQGPMREGVVIQGAEHYLNDKSLNSGVEKYSIETESGNVNFNLRWFIMEEEMHNHFAIYSPFFAIKHKQELYGNLAGSHSRTALLRSCGTSRASDRLVFIVEFEDCKLSVPNNRKSVTIDSYDVDIVKVCETISENLPEGVQKFKEEVINSIPPQDLIQQSLRDFIKSNYYIKKSPNLKVVSGDPSTPPNPSSTNPPPNSSHRDKPKSTKPMGGTKNTNSKRKAKAMMQKHELPNVIEDDTLPDDVWCDMNVKQWELTYNPNFKDIEQMINYSTLLDYSKCPKTRRNIVLGGLLTKSVEWIFNQVHKNIKEQDSKIQHILNPSDLTKQAWLSSAAFAKQKKSESSK